MKYKYYDPYDYGAYPIVLPAADYGKGLMLRNRAEEDSTEVTVTASSSDTVVVTGYASAASLLSSYAPYGLDEPQVSPLSYLPSLDYIRINPVQTDEQGEFAFTGLENSKYELTLYDPQARYLFCRYPEYPLINGAAPEYLELSEKKTSLEGIEISLKRGGRLEGKVLDGSAPLAGVSVRATPASSGYKEAYGYPVACYPGMGSEDMTDTDGEFIIRGLEEGEYILLATDQTGTRNFVASFCLDQSAGEEKPRTFKVTEGSTESGVVISMKPGASISGRVVDKEGKPLAGIVMSTNIERIPDYDPDRPWDYYYPTYRSVTTGQDGTYALVGMSEGTYTLRAWDQNQKYLDGCQSGITISPSASLTAPDMTLAKSLILSGKVTSSDGKPLAEVVVSASLNYSSDPAGSSSQMPTRTADYCAIYPKYQAQAYTGKDGTYRITGLAAGIYRLEAQDYNNGYLSAQYGTGYSPTPIAGAEGEEKTGLDFSLVRGGMITGTVLDQATGKPVSGVTVIAQSDSGGGQAGSGGGYYAPYGYSSDAVASDLPIALTTEVPAILPIDPGQDPGFIRVPGKTYYSAPTDSKGKYTLKGLADGKYLLYVSTTEKNYLSQYYSGVSSEDEATPVEVRSEQVVENIDFSLAPGGTIKGVIREAATGKPMTTGCLVILTTEQGSDIKSTYTNSAGEYQFKGLQSGTYLVKAADCQYNYGGFYRLPGTDLKASSPITVSAPGTVEGIDILLPLKPSISGRVVDELDKKPLARIMITAIPKSVYSKPYANDTAYYTSYSPVSSYAPPDIYYSGYRAITDADGRYTVKGLVEGDYLIVATDTAHIYGREYYQNVPADQPDKATVVHVDLLEAKEGINLELQVGETYIGTVSSNSQYPTTSSYGYAAAPNPYYGSSTAYLQLGGNSGLYGGVAGYMNSSDAARQAQWNSSQPGINQYPAQYPILPEQPTNTQPPQITSSNSVNRIKAGRTFMYKIELDFCSIKNKLKKRALIIFPGGSGYTFPSFLV